MLTSILLLSSCLSLPLREVVDLPGKYCAAGSGACVSLAREEGGSLCITVSGSKARPGHGCDVTALAWLSGEEILFSTASIYGTPGIYRYHLKEGKERTVVRSRVRDAAYPDGKDFFKLISVVGDDAKYWYCDDIEKLDESALDKAAVKQTVSLKRKRS